MICLCSDEQHSGVLPSLSSSNQTTSSKKAPGQTRGFFRDARRDKDNH
ncbi:hypothetical protein SynBIOSE41_01757 [Synechococcus sp. BIOS-E4-1]|nr:hypothetical protein SynBIOSE41_01757 [Synechococcus sp. BIOS-E4-1]